MIINVGPQGLKWAWKYFKVETGDDLIKINELCNYFILYYFEVVIEEDIDPIIAVELFLLKENKISMGNIEREVLFWYMKVKSCRPFSLKRLFHFILGFPATWSIEAGFSATHYALTRKRNLLQTEREETYAWSWNNSWNFTVLPQLLA